jgi:branched-chain amino acid transport system permease protein
MNRAALLPAAPRPLIAWSRGFGIICVLAVATLPVWPFANGFIVAVAIRALIFIALGQAWNVIAGIGGQLSLGHGVFFGIGAYATALLFNLWNIPPWIGFLGGMLAAMGVAAVIGAITFRLRGVYFALATVVISLAFEKLARFDVDLTGGDSGLAVRFLGDSLWGLQSRGPTPFLWPALAVVLGFRQITASLLASRFGLELQAVRDDEEAAAASGVAVFRTKLLGLLLSAAMTALVGALHVQFYLTIDPGNAFGLFQAIQIQLPALIGGLGTVAGPIIGGAIMVGANEATNWFSAVIGIDGLDVLCYGLLLLFIVMRAPEGIVGRLSARRRR